MRTRLRRSLVRAGAALLAAAALAACRARPAPRLAVVGTEDACAGARLATADVNRTGGIGGRRLELVVVDENVLHSAGDPVTHAQAVVRDVGVLGVVGHSGSGPSVAAAGVYRAAGMAQVAPTTTSPVFDADGPYAFSLVPDDRRQAEFLAGQVAGHAGERVALVYRNDDYGRQIATALRGRLRVAGVPLVFDAPYEGGAAAEDLEVLAGSLVLRLPTTLFWLGNGQDLRQVLPRLRARIRGLRVLGSDALGASETYANPGGVYTGVQFVRFVDPGAPGYPAELRRRFRAIRGEELTDGAALSYDAIWLLAGALRAGATTRAGVWRYLLSLGRERPPFQGVAGPISFPDGHRVPRSYLLVEVTDTGVRRVRQGAGAVQ